MYFTVTLKVEYVFVLTGCFHILFQSRKKRSRRKKDYVMRVEFYRVGNLSSLLLLLF